MASSSDPENRMEGLEGVPNEPTLSGREESGIKDVSDVLKQRFYYAEKRPVIKSALAIESCSKLSVDELLEKLSGILGTSYALETRSESLRSALESCIERGYDFGTTYARLRPYWFEDASRDIVEDERKDQDMRKQLLSDNKIIDGDAPPRRVWDLYANRVVPFWVVRKYPWAISHAWVDKDELTHVMTPINQNEWPVPIPQDANLDLIRIEMLNLGAEYVWLDVLCMRQKLHDKEKEELREKGEEGLPEILRKKVVEGKHRLEDRSLEDVHMELQAEEARLEALKEAWKAGASWEAREQALEQADEEARLVARLVAARKVAARAMADVEAQLEEAQEQTRLARASWREARKRLEAAREQAGEEAQEASASWREAEEEQERKRLEMKKAEEERKRLERKMAAASWSEARLLARLKAAQLEDARLEELRLEEWKVDVPTIGWVYRKADQVVCYFGGFGRPLSKVDLESDQCWFNRAWTLQEMNIDPIIAGRTHDGDIMTEGLPLVSLRQIRRDDFVFDILSKMQTRKSTKPVDRIAALVYLFHSKYIPIYHENQSEEDAWTALLNVTQDWFRADLFFFYPEPGDGKKFWRPSWNQAMNHTISWRDPSQVMGEIQWEKGKDVDLYRGPYIESGDVQGLGHATDASAQKKPRRGELCLKDCNGVMHTFKIIADHVYLIPDGPYTLIGSIGSPSIQSALLWVVGKMEEEEFKKISVFSMADDRAAARLQRLGVAKDRKMILW